MGQLVTFPTDLPPAAVSRIAGRMIARYNLREIGDAIELLMDLLDCLGGDSDFEVAEPFEDDDPREQDDPAEDDDADEDDDPKEDSGENQLEWC